MEEKAKSQSPSSTSTSSSLRRPSPVAGSSLGYSNLTSSPRAVGGAQRKCTTDQQGQISSTNLDISDIPLDPAWNLDPLSTSSRTSTPFGAREMIGSQGAVTLTSTPNSTTIFLVETQETNDAKKRRESNRASQRAFKARKEKHREYLERQLTVLQGQYDNLLQLSTVQAENIDKLKAQIAGLTAELDSARFSGVVNMSEMANLDRTSQHCDLNFDFDILLLQGQPSYDLMDITGHGTDLPQF